MRYSSIARKFAGAVFGIAALGMASFGASADDETVNIGFNAALSGEAAGWALPGLTGLKMWVDEVNAKGGLKVGDTRRKVVLHQFDNENVPSKALQGAKDLVYNHDVKLILDIGGTTGEAQIPFLMKNKVFYAPLAATDINPKRPYVIAGHDVYPRGEMMRPLYQKSVHVGLQRFAIISQEDQTAFVGQAWEIAAAMAAGWDVVYDAHFAPDATDFAPVVTAMLAEKPDAISLGITWPGFIPLIMEQLYQQGFEGPVSANYIEWPAVLEKVPAEWIEKVAGYDSYPTFDDPWWGRPSLQSNFADAWNARFGKGAPEDVGTTMTGIDWLYVPITQVWAYGVEASGSLDPDKVLAAVRAAKSINTLEGAAVMTGKDLWGIDNMMSIPVPTSRFFADCKCKRVVQVMRYEPWFEAHKDEIIAEVRKRGLMWDQIK